MTSLREKLAERLIAGGALDEIVTVALDDYLQVNLKGMQDIAYKPTALTKANKIDFLSYQASANACIIILRDFTTDKSYQKEEDDILLLTNTFLSHTHSTADN